MGFFCYRLAVLPHVGSLDVSNKCIVFDSLTYFEIVAFVRVMVITQHNVLSGILKATVKTNVGDNYVLF